MRNAKLGNHFKESLLAESQDATFWSSWFIILCNVSIHLWLRNKLESSARRMTDKTSEHLEISFHCTEKFRNLVIMHVFIQEPITRRVQLPHIPVTAFSHTDLFLVWIYRELTRTPQQPQWPNTSKEFDRLSNTSKFTYPFIHRWRPSTNLLKVVVCCAVMEKFAIPNYINGASVYSSSETQGLLVSLNGQEKKIGRR